MESVRISVRRSVGSWAWRLYLVGLHVCVVAALLAARSPAPNGLPPHWRSLVAAHRRVDPQVPAGAVAFIGDSHIAGLCVATVTPTGVNLGIGSDTTDGVLNRLPVYQCLSRCRAIVVHVGINDLIRLSDDEILDRYRRILAAAPGHVLVVWSAILPVDERCDKRFDGYNARIAALNASAKAACAERPKTIWIDSGPDLADSSGNLATDNRDSDGVHLTETGYRIWSVRLRAALS